MPTDLDAVVERLWEEAEETRIESTVPMFQDAYKNRRRRKLKFK